MKKETCSILGCSLSPSSNGKCWKHQKEEKVTPVKDGFKSQVELFNYVWDTRDRKCFVTKEKLDKYNGTMLFLNLFAHILKKASGFFKEYKLNEKNIVLLSPDVHRIFDNPTLTSILKFEEKNNCSFEPLFDLEIKLLEEYNKEFNDNKILRKIISLYYQNKRQTK